MFSGSYGNNDSSIPCAVGHGHRKQSGTGFANHLRTWAGGISEDGVKETLSSNTHTHTHTHTHTPARARILLLVCKVGRSELWILAILKTK